MRLVPDMTASNALAMLKAHLVKHGFGVGGREDCRQCYLRVARPATH